ncbi:sugar-transfer associated ATP-grasp domain-containing protein [Lacimicrobium alkaliphilum]|uniref:Alpha-L-glutamate ligase-related protein ATP-grasp domain-containing protein n=1 Tax=Lacimicrobium alkaliphilum TaxID=1526571 RepID=A0A0U3AU89_9ALTE|nr:sugar-transfer associated ATP-grasp domain-containing protein [Lacimicrobium alkaliphilum]ALS97663.1 hypothetical protein AT746_04840 [Lacimicrobium alkaliphilum]
MNNYIFKLKSLYRQAQEVKRAHNKSITTQILDIIQLYRLNPCCDVWDYYKYRIYTAERGSERYSNTLGSGYIEPFNRSLNVRTGVTVSWDKLLFAQVCEVFKLPTVHLVGVFKPAGPLADFIPVKMNQIDQVKDMMASRKEPMFVKPVLCQQGIGGYYVESYDQDTDKVITKDGKTFTFDEFIKLTINNPDTRLYRRRMGYLFQDVVSQHPAINEFTGTVVPSGLRVMVLNDEHNPIVHSAVWKVVMPGNTNDNFSKGKSGNLVCRIDPENGSVSVAINGFWPFAKYSETHPTTGKRFEDFTIPHWDKLLTEIKHASSVISTMNILHWDVIMGEEGPVILELNDIGGTEFLQIHETALMDRTMRDFMRRYANLKKGERVRRMLEGH